MGSLLLSTACVGQWDIPKTARHDPCTGEAQDRYVYVAPACIEPPVKHPLDADDAHSHK